MDRLEEVWNLDPSDRMRLQLFADDSLDDQSEAIATALSQDVFLVRLKQLVWKQLQEESDEKASLSRVKGIFEENSYKEIISNVACKVFSGASTMKNSLLLNQPMLCRRSCDELVDHLREARVAWESGILEELRAIIVEAKRPFVLLRDKMERCPFLDGAAHGDKETNVKFLFDSEDLMETVLAIRNPNLLPEVRVGLVQVSAHSLTLEAAQRRFPELSNLHCQLGLDEAQTSAQGLRVLVQRQEEGEAILSSGSMREARRFLRRGAPPSMRARMWRQACGLYEKCTAAEDQHFARLRYDCDRLDLVSDELVMHDLQTVLDDPRFFVFEEELKEVLLCFSRDRYVRSHALYEIHAPLLKEMGGEFPVDEAAPPSAVQPYLGFSTYFAPLCYIFKHKPSLYSVTRHLYCSLWCKLNVLCSDSGTLVALCQAFESLLMDCNARLFLHLVSIGVQPLRVAFPWMQLAFIGLLEIDQLLHLWERVIGYMDITLLAVAAVAIFAHRSEMLLRCTSDQDVITILMEGSRLHIVPLLQMMLLRGDTKM